MGIISSIYNSGYNIKRLFLGEQELKLAYLGEQIVFNEVINDLNYVLYEFHKGKAISNTIEAPVKSAILKGNTKYRDIDTGDILDTFDETKNLELVSVKMPVLMTTGKNLFDGVLELGGLDTTSGLPNAVQTDRYRSVNYIKVKPNTSYIFSLNYNSTIGVREFDEGYGFLKWYSLAPNANTFTTSENAHFIRFIVINTYSDNQIQLEEGSVATEYEPYKSNILTVNEDVTLRSNGDICDELNLLTGQLTQRIGEDGVALSQEVVKTVDLTIVDQGGKTTNKLNSFNGTTHVSTEVAENSVYPTIAIEVAAE